MVYFRLILFRIYRTIYRIYILDISNLFYFRTTVFGRIYNNLYVLYFRLILFRIYRTIYRIYILDISNLFYFQLRTVFGRICISVKFHRKLAQKRGVTK